MFIFSLSAAEARKESARNSRDVCFLADGPLDPDPDPASSRPITGLHRLSGGQDCA